MARIAGVDLPREKRIEVGLTYVYGIGQSTADEILAGTGINPDTRVKDLTEDETARLREVIEHEYTIEGDPVTIDVSFDGKTFISTQDTTQDQFGPQQVTTAEWGYLLNSELVADTYGDGSPRTVRTTWFLSPVPQKEIDANPLAEYDSLYLFDRTDTLR